MEFKVRNGNGIICELTVTSGNTTIMEDMATEGMKVPKSEIENLIKAAVELSRFNKDSDFDFITDIIDNWANDTERSHIIEYLSNQ